MIINPETIPELLKIRVNLKGDQGEKTQDFENREKSQLMSNFVKYLMEVQFIKPYTHLDGIFASNNREGRNLPVLMEHTLQGLVLNAADPVHVANIEVITLVLAEPGKQNNEEELQWRRAEQNLIKNIAYCIGKGQVNELKLLKEKQLYAVDVTQTIIDAGDEVNKLRQQLAELKRNTVKNNQITRRQDTLTQKETELALLQKEKAKMNGEIKDAGIEKEKMNIKIKDLEQQLQTQIYQRVSLENKLKEVSSKAIFNNPLSVLATINQKGALAAKLKSSLENFNGKQLAMVFSLYCWNMKAKLNYRDMAYNHPNLLFLCQTYENTIIGAFSTSGLQDTPTQGKGFIFAITSDNQFRQFHCKGGNSIIFKHDDTGILIGPQDEFFIADEAKVLNSKFATTKNFDGTEEEHQKVINKKAVEFKAYEFLQVFF